MNTDELRLKRLRKFDGDQVSTNNSNSNSSNSNSNSNRDDNNAKKMKTTKTTTTSSSSSSAEVVYDLTNDNNDNNDTNDDFMIAKKLQDEYTNQCNGMNDNSNDDDDLLYAKALQEQFDRDLIENDNSSLSTLSSLLPSSLQKVEDWESKKMEDWQCSSCSTMNRIADFDKFRCKNDCDRINPAIVMWIRHQRLVHNLWVKGKAVTGFGLPTRSYRNFGSIINGNYNEYSGLLSYW